MVITRAQLHRALKLIPRLRGREAFDFYAEIDAIQAESTRRCVEVMQEEVELPDPPPGLIQALEAALDDYQYADALLIKPIHDAYTRGGEANGRAGGEDAGPGDGRDQ